ncbi:MAG: hypothetical protein DSY89_11130 [Deltaproteobacteria bacterium]|nr:MAG: hypothetical protein DSY89_11130 [Deltaproteobacteria bacterium]
MQISNIAIVEKDDRIRLSARVLWEDCDQPEREVYIETEKSWGDGLTLNSDAFLVGCLVPAMHFGERRLALEGAVCPYLKEGIDTVMTLVQGWSNGRLKPLHIEAPVQPRILPAVSGHTHAAMVLSGGIDSLATLRLNRRHYPVDHPGAIRDGFIIHGFDIGGVVERGMKYHVFDRARQALSAVAEDAGISLIPVYTNIRHLCDDRALWLDYFFGSVLAAVGHAFSSRINLLYLASSFDLPNLVPCGSHPLLDPEFSSYHLRIRHSHVELSRMDKLQVVYGWEAAFQNFRVCLANVPDRQNCGKCEKCVRTMLGLAGLGILDKTRAFIEDDVTADMLEPFEITIRHRPPFYRELLAPLKRQGRDDLVSAIEKKLSGKPPL